MLPSYHLFSFINYYNEAVDVLICALLTRNHCKVSDTQVTVKAYGTLGFFIVFIFTRDNHNVSLVFLEGF